VSGVGIGMGVLDFGGDRPRGRGSLGGEFAASHYNQWGLMLHRCVEVRKAIKLSFGVVSGVGPGIHVLDGRPRASSGRVCFWHGMWHFSASQHALISLGLMTLRNAFDSCVKS